MDPCGVFFMGPEVTLRKYPAGVWNFTNKGGETMRVKVRSV